MFSKIIKSLTLLTVALAISSCILKKEDDASKDSTSVDVKDKATVSSLEFKYLAEQSDTDGSSYYFYINPIEPAVSSKFPTASMYNKDVDGKLNPEKDVMFLVFDSDKYDSASAYVQLTDKDTVKTLATDLKIDGNNVYSETLGLNGKATFGEQKEFFSITQTNQEKITSKSFNKTVTTLNTATGRYSENNCTSDLGTWDANNKKCCKEVRPIPYNELDNSYWISIYPLPISVSPDCCRTVGQGVQYMDGKTPVCCNKTNNIINKFCCGKFGGFWNSSSNSCSSTDPTVLPSLPTTVISKPNNNLIIPVEVHITPTETGCNGGPLYKLRDRGPAGGIIFYDKGSCTDGWRYMEAAPTDIMKTVAVTGSQLPPQFRRTWRWGCNDWSTHLLGSMFLNPFPAPIAKEIGAGKANTEAIVYACNDPISAARLCNELVVGNYSDWWLPSSGELFKMAQNVMYGFPVDPALNKDRVDENGDVFLHFSGLTGAIGVQITNILASNGFGFGFGFDMYGEWKSFQEVDNPKTMLFWPAGTTCSGICLGGGASPSTHGLFAYWSSSETVPQAPYTVGKWADYVDPYENNHVGGHYKPNYHHVRCARRF